MHNSNKALRLTQRLIDVSPDVDVTHVTALFADCNVVVCTDQDGATMRLDILDVGKLRWCLGLPAGLDEFTRSAISSNSIVSVVCAS